MRLFLLISLQQDPLYLPSSFSTQLAGRFPDVSFFHMDNHASPELVSTAIRAVDTADSLALLVRVLDENVKANSLFQVMRKITEFDRPLLWLEEGDSPFRTFRNLARGASHAIARPEEIWDHLQDFYY